MLSLQNDIQTMNTFPILHKNYSTLMQAERYYWACPTGKYQIISARHGHLTLVTFASCFFKINRMCVDCFKIHAIDRIRGTCSTPMVLVTATMRSVLRGRERESRIKMTTKVIKSKSGSKTQAQRSLKEDMVMLVAVRVEDGHLRAGWIASNGHKCILGSTVECSKRVGTETLYAIMDGW